MDFIILIRVLPVHNFFNTFSAATVETLFTLFAQPVDNLFCNLFQFFPVFIQLKNI